MLRKTSAWAARTVRCSPACICFSHAHTQHGPSTLGALLPTGRWSHLLTWMAVPGGQVPSWLLMILDLLCGPLGVLFVTQW